MKRVSLVLAIIGMFVMPMIPVKASHPVLPPYENEGDIVLVDGSVIPGIPKWDHAQIYVGMVMIMWKFLLVGK